MPSHCHPNPCENSGKCIDKYDYLGDHSEVTSDRRMAPSSKASNDLQAMPSFFQPGTEGITPVDSELLRANGNVRDSISKHHSFDEEPGSEKKEPYPAKFYGIAIRKKSRIPTVNGRGDIPKAIEANHLLKTERHHMPMHKLAKNNVPRYDRKSNSWHKLETKRSLILKKLPNEVDYDELNIDGFVCICSEHFKGKKCERELHSFQLFCHITSVLRQFIFL